MNSESTQINEIILGANSRAEISKLLGSMANRHGLIAGATGTGKTVSMQVLAEGFSKLGVPVFAADIKGDLSGIATPGKEHPKISERKEKIGLNSHSFQGFPVVFWDLLGESGLPVRSTISEMGPLLLGRLLELNDTQEGILEAAFKFADDQGLLLLDLKDLRSLLAWFGDHASELRTKYGNISGASIGAIQRKLLGLEESGADLFFGEPALKLEHLMQVDYSGKGIINLLDATKVVNDPRVYSTFLLWLLSELFEELEEVGDKEKPKLVFFFDEAHLLFKSAPPSLVERIETLTRLIRSKGVGVYYITQEPGDIPESVLGQLGNRIQHALRAYTPSAQKDIKAAANAFRPNPEIDCEKLITDLGVGEAIISLLDEQGAPTVAEHILVSPPESRIGPLQQAEREELLKRTPLNAVYREPIDRESAHEILAKRREKEVEEEEAEKARKEAQKSSGSSRRQSAGEAFFKSILRSVGSQVGRQIARGILGSMKR